MFHMYMYLKSTFRGQLLEQIVRFKQLFGTLHTVTWIKLHSSYLHRLQWWNLMIKVDLEMLS